MADVAVVGAGLNGLATAWALRRAGVDVVVYEQFELGHTRGSSHGRTRIFRLAYPEEKWVRFAQDALDGWRELERGERGGAAPAQRPARAVPRGRAELAGSPARRATPPASCSPGRRRRPGSAWCPTDDASVLFQPDAGVVFADRALSAFARGLRIETGRRVESLDELDEPVVVVTAGPWARRLLEPAGIELPVVETRETVAYFRLEGPVPSVVAEVVTRGHGFYSLYDPLYGLKVGSHMRGSPADPDEERGPDDALVQEIADWTRERFPRADPTPVHAESCFYTTTDDERFVLERHGRIVVGSACSGHGFKFGPATGKRLAALAVEGLG